MGPCLGDNANEWGASSSTLHQAEPVFNNAIGIT